MLAARGTTRWKAAKIIWQFPRKTPLALLNRAKTTDISKSEDIDGRHAFDRGDKFVDDDNSSGENLKTLFSRKNEKDSVPVTLLIQTTYSRWTREINF